MSDATIVELHRVEDRVLVGRAQAGDRAAFEELFRRHLALVVRSLARLLGADADVPDLSNEVLLLAWQRLGQVTDGTRFRAFLGGVCVNVARNRLRSRRRRRWLVFGSEAVVEPPVPDVSDAREALQATFAVLEGMHDDLRTCFALRYLDQRELTEIAEWMEVSLATVKRWLQRAEQDFLSRAKGHPALTAWVTDGSRWGGAA